MLLKAEPSLMPKVFMVFAAFWVTVLIVLYVVVGVLLKKGQRSGGSAPGGHGGHH